MEVCSVEEKSLICLIIPYFGQWPIYFKLFLDTVGKQKNLQVLLFTDIEYQDVMPKNVTITHLTMYEFNKLASFKLNLSINIKNPYKLCDFKPAYGLIFEDYINEYNYWAFGDLDLIYGSLIEELPLDWQDYDILSFRKEWISGSLAIFKNIEYIKNLFKRSKAYKECFLSLEHKAFDECFNLYHVMIGKKANSILEYDNNESFTWVVRKEEAENKIKVYSKKLIKESIPDDDYVYYNHGRIEQKDGTSLLYYHYITEKKTNRFNFPNWKKIPNEFYINNTGFFTVDEFLSWRYYLITYLRKVYGYLKFFYHLPLRVYLKMLKVMRVKT